MRQREDTGANDPELELVADLELRIAIKTAADTADIRGYDQVSGLLTIACLTLDDAIEKKERTLRSELAYADARGGAAPTSRRNVKTTFPSKI